MKLTINQSPEIEQTEIIINCPAVTPELNAVIERIRLLDCTISGRKDGEVYRVPVEQVLYFDSTDSRSFAYCGDGCYQVRETIGELEERLRNQSFVRISKNTLVSLRALKSAGALEFSRMILTLTNGERLIVSRHYLAAFKEAFGI